MLEKWFAHADTEIEALSRYFDRLGKSGTIMLAVMAYGVYSLIDMISFVTGHHH